MQKKMSRYEINQHVKTVLVRNGADLSKINWSSSERSISIWGELTKDPSGDFDLRGVENLFNEMQRISYDILLQVELENWNVVYDFGSWVINKRKAPSSSGDINQKSLRIDIEEKVKDVVKDIEGGEKKRT